MAKNKFLLLKLIFTFYKSTLIINIAISFIFAALAYPLGYGAHLFAISFITAGPVICILYKETTAQNQYYFYYNLGISKTLLLMSFLALNLITGVMVYIIHLL